MVAETPGSQLVMGEIYELILLRRPVAQIRTMWLPEEYQ